MENSASKPLFSVLYRQKIASGMNFVFITDGPENSASAMQTDNNTDYCWDADILLCFLLQKSLW